MGLPKLNAEKVFTKVRLPSGKTIGVHPWKVREEKELLFAIEAADGLHLEDDIIRFYQNCVDDVGTFDGLSTTDMLRVAVEARKLSKGASIEYEYPCPECTGLMLTDEVSLVKDIKVKDFDQSPTKVGDLTFTFKEVPHSLMTRLQKEFEVLPKKYAYNLFLNSIDTVTHKEEVFTTFTVPELEEFIDGLDPDTFEEVGRSMLEKSASVQLEKKITCKKCGTEISVQFGNLFDFFAL
jgi:hypothetical protein